MRRKGFTIVELLLVIGIMMVLGVIGIMSLAGRKEEEDLSATTQRMGTLLRQAQSDAVEQESEASWGVRFANPTTTTPFYALFSGSYSTGTVVGYYPLPPTVAYVTSTLASGATLDVTFSPIIGTASVSTTIRLYMPTAATFSSTISVASSGEVTY